MEEKVFYLELIEVYRGLPALWQVKSKEYANRNIKSAQYEVLLEKYRERYPDAEKKDVTLKINSLRTSYRKELKRISRVEKSGAGADDEAQTSLYYFEALNFLRDNELPCTSQTSMDEESTEMTAEEPRKRKKPDAAEELMMLAAKRLRQSPEEWDRMAEGWALKLRQMSNTQRLLADKFINEILFEGQMGTLHRQSMQLNILSPQTTNSTPQTPSTYSYNTNISLTRSSTPSRNITVPLTSPEIINSETEAVNEDSLTHYFASFE